MKQIKVVLDWFANTNHTGYYVAIDKGYYKNEGLDVQISGDVHGVLTVGDADIVVGPEPSLLMDMHGGEKLTAVAVQAQKADSGIISLAEAGITRPAELTGKRLTHWKPVWFHHVISKLVNDDGGEYDKIQLIEKDVGDIEEALGNVADAVWVYKNWEYYVMVHAGKRVNYFPLTDYGPLYNFCAPAVTAKHGFIDGSPEALRAFLGATERGYQEASKDPDGSANMLLNYMGEGYDAKLVQESQRYIAPYYLDENGRWGHIRSERWTIFADWMVEKGVIPKRPEREFTNEFLSR